MKSEMLDNIEQSPFPLQLICVCSKFEKMLGKEQKIVQF